MATYEIPTSAGKEFWTITSYAGTPIVTNGKTGKDKISIPCKDMRKAEAIIQKLVNGEHDGTIHA